jgi:hypothetical protein
VTNVIEAAADVAFQNPLSTATLHEHLEALLNGVSRRTPWPKAIGVRVGGSFGDWLLAPAEN